MPEHIWSRKTSKVAQEYLRECPEGHPGIGEEPDESLKSTSEIPEGYIDFP